MNATATATSTMDTLLLPPNGYRVLWISNLILCSVSSILCVVLIVAMTLPLLYPKRRKEYSTYNLYLAYLAIPDLAANAFIVYLILAHTKGIPDETNENVTWMFDHSFDHPVYISCVTANLYTNAFLTFGIFCLLKDSSIRKRHYPPSIAKVTMQAMISYGLGGSFILLDYLVADRLEGKTEKIRTWSTLYKAFTFIFCLMIPLSALVIVCAMIYRQRLFRSTKSMFEGRLRVLTLFFARIIFVDILIWTPAAIAYLISWSSEEVNRTKVIAYNVAILFSGSQSVVSFACSLTKPDARKLVVDLLTCVYCRRCKGEQHAGRKAGDETLQTNEHPYVDPYLRASIHMIRSIADRTSFFIATDRMSVLTQQSVQLQEHVPDEEFHAITNSVSTNDAAGPCCIPCATAPSPSVGV